MGRPYRPSNGSEGDCFHAAFCNHCARDAAFRETGYEGDPALGCQILAASMAYSTRDPEYPQEWITDDEKGPRCTAYTTDPTMPLRCDKTADMFEPHYRVGHDANHNIPHRIMMSTATFPSG